MSKIGKATFIPDVDFIGYPFGHKVEFRAGVQSIPVAESYAKLMREKGLVKPGTHIQTVAEESKEDK